jgi:FkbM family methyltransferase
MFKPLRSFYSKINRWQFRIRAFRNWYTLVFPLNRFLPKERLLVCRNGLKLFVADITSSAIGMTREVWEKNDYGQLPSKGAVIVDIGANIGAFTLFAAQKTKARIFALEPMKDPFAALKKNIALNNLESRVVPLRIALCGENGEREMHVSKRNMGGSSLYITSDRTEQVVCKTLPAFFEENNIDYVDYIKCDCEGAEYDIFLNTPPALFEKIGIITVELHTVEHHTFDELREFFHTVGYSTQWSKTPRLLHARRS